MKAWFLNLSFREKQVVFYGGILVGLFLIYEIIFASLFNDVNNLRVKVRSDAHLLSWMQKTNYQIKALEKSAPAQSDNALSGSLLSTMQTALDDTPFGKNIIKLQQAENDSVQVKLQKVPFDEFTKWLIDFTQQYQLSILQFTIVPTTDSGIVSLDLKLA